MENNQFKMRCKRKSTQIQQVVIKQSIIPELVSGSSTCAVTQQQAWKTLKKFQGLSYFTTAHGFTLIELLVVVLIIGILAAVAVPQYQVAVMKAKFANLLSVSRMYQRAAQEYVAANGTWPTRFEDLSIDPPGSFTPATPRSNECVQGPDMYCCLMEPDDGYQTDGITCGTADYKLGYSVLYAVNTNSIGHFCVAKTEDVVANRVCRTYNQTTAPSMNLSTPTGHQTGYQNYQMLDIK